MAVAHGYATARAEPTGENIRTNAHLVLSLGVAAVLERRVAQHAAVTAVDTLRRPDRDPDPVWRRQTDPASSVADHPVESGGAGS